MSSEYPKAARSRPPAPGTRPTGPALPADRPDTAASLRYRPIWNVQQKVMGIYMCEPPTPAGVPPHASCDIEAAGRADAALLDRVLIDIDRVSRQRDAGSVCLPVHHSSLIHTAARGAFVARCDRIPPELRQLLVWEIADMPPGTGERSLFSMVATLKPFARAIFVRTRLDDDDFDVPAAVGVHSVGLDLSESDKSETHVSSLLEKFARNAHRAGLRCHAHGLATSSISLSAVGSGFDYLAGDAICGTVDAPWGVQPFDAENLFLSRLVPGD